ncbi:MAG: serine/threonine protein kinase [Chromatiales bacterium]|nr:serine/threonine protein kinase [Chromatiales bacterium]
MSKALLTMELPCDIASSPYTLAESRGADILIIDLELESASRALEAYGRRHDNQPALIAIGPGAAPKDTHNHLPRPLSATTLHATLAQIGTALSIGKDEPTNIDMDGDDGAYTSANILVPKHVREQAQVRQEEDGVGLVTVFESDGIDLMFALGVKREIDDAPRLPLLETLLVWLTEVVSEQRGHYEVERYCDVLMRLAEEVSELGRAGLAAVTLRLRRQLLRLDTDELLAPELRLALVDFPVTVAAHLAQPADTFHIHALLQHLSSAQLELDTELDGLERVEQLLLKEAEPTSAQRHARHGLPQPVHGGRQRDLTIRYGRGKKGLVVELLGEARDIETLAGRAGRGPTNEPWNVEIEALATSLAGQDSTGNETLDYFSTYFDNLRRASIGLGGACRLRHRDSQLYIRTSVPLWLTHTAGRLVPASGGLLTVRESGIEQLVDVNITDVLVNGKLEQLDIGGTMYRAIWLHQLLGLDLNRETQDMLGCKAMLTRGPGALVAVLPGGVSEALRFSVRGVGERMPKVAGIVGGTVLVGGELSPLIDLPTAINAYIRANALGAAHAAGVIHRDVKPGNVLFRGDGSIALTDFGIAKAKEAAVSLTRTNSMVGTPHYISPEQVRGAEIDHRADMYSLGILFFEMLAAQRPYRADRPVLLLDALLHSAIPEVTERAQHLQPIINKLLVKRPQDRFQSANQLVRAL